MGNFRRTEAGLSSPAGLALHDSQYPAALNQPLSKHRSPVSSCMVLAFVFVQSVAASGCNLDARCTFHHFAYHCRIGKTLLPEQSQHLVDGSGLACN